MDEGIRKRWETNDFDGGLVTNFPAHTLKPNQSPDAENFDPSYRRILHPRLPFTAFIAHSDATANVRGLYHYVKSAGTTYVVAKKGTSFYDVSAGNYSTAIVSPTIADGDNAFFAVLNDILIVTSDSASNWNTAQQWSGSGAMSNLTGAATLGAKYPVVHKGRLWLFNSEATAAQRSAAAFSALNDPTDFTTANNAGNFYIDKSAGTVINAACSDGDVIYVSKISPSGEKGAIYAIYGDGPANFVVKKIADSPVVGSRAIVNTPLGVVALTNHGIFLFATKSLSLTGEKGMVPLGLNVDRTFLHNTPAVRATIALGTYKNQVFVGLPSVGIYVCDIPSARWSRYTSTGAYKVNVFSLAGTGLLYSAGAGSNAITLLTDNTGGTSDFATAGPTMYWITPEVYFDSMFLDKKMERLGVYGNGANTAWTATLYTDGTAQANTYSVNMSTGTPSGESKLERVSGAHTVGRRMKMKVHISGSILSGSYPTETVAELYGMMFECNQFQMTR